VDQPESLESLGWSDFFDDQLAAEEAELERARIDAVHRGRLGARTPAGQIEVALPPRSDTGDYAVGDGS
jgi:ribosome biogenesis GTPase